MGHRNSKFANPAFLTGLVVLVTWCIVTLLWPVVVIYYFVIMGLMFATYGTYCSFKSRIAKIGRRKRVEIEPSELPRGHSSEAFKSKWFEPADDLPPPPLTGRKAKPTLDL